MVKVRDDHPRTEDGNIDLDSWFTKIHRVSGEEELPVLAAACRFVCNHGFYVKGTIAEPLRMGMEMVDILVHLRLDEASLVTALLYRLVREKQLDTETIREDFGAEVTGLIDGVLGMAVISVLQGGENEPILGDHQGVQLEKIRKMLVSIIDDVRVALIKIAERTCVIRLAKNDSEEKGKRVAREVFAIYGPLAHRLGIGYVKWELEDLAFSHLNPEAYKRIAKLLDERRLDREEYLRASISHLLETLHNAGIEADIQGRVKHIYSIWRKMQRKNLEFHELYDIRALRILVDEVQDCYAALGVTHSLWQHIPGEFDDYIATPKANGYQSLHTAILGPEGKTLEVQIRTHAMHEEAELGVCSHWAYKGTDTGSKSDSYEQKLSWLRQVLEWHEEIGQDIDGFADQWRGDVEPDRVYVFTRDGHVVDLPAGATPVDFAYRVHTEIGNRCRGAKVSGRIVPLTYTLKTGDQIDVLTAGNVSPSRDWLNPEMGYVTTSRARAKVINWFRRQNRGANIIAGQQMLESELKRLALRKTDYEKLAKKANFIMVDDLFAACGAGDVRLNHIIRLAQRQVIPENEDSEEPRLKQRLPQKRDHTDIVIEGVGNLLTQIAGCCNPVPGDAILGYITQGRGVSIHRRDCLNALQLKEHEPERILVVHWCERNMTRYPVRIKVEAFDRPGLIRDLTQLLSNEKVNVIGLNTHVFDVNNEAHVYFKVEIGDIDSLGRLLAKINRVANVMAAYRNEELVSS